MRRERDDVPLTQRLLARPEEAAAMLGVGRSTIYEMLRLGELPVVHIGRSARIPIQALRRWVELHGTGALDAPDTPAASPPSPQSSSHNSLPKLPYA